MGKGYKGNILNLCGVECKELWWQRGITCFTLFEYFSMVIVHSLILFLIQKKRKDLGKYEGTLTMCVHHTEFFLYCHIFYTDFLFNKMNKTVHSKFKYPLIYCPISTYLFSFHCHKLFAKYLYNIYLLLVCIYY